MTLTLTSGLVSRIGIESYGYSIFFEVGIPNLVWECILGGGESHAYFAHCDLDLLHCF